MVSAEVQKVEQWKQHCRDVTRSSTADKNLLSGALLEVCKHFSMQALCFRFVFYAIDLNILLTYLNNM